MKRYREMQRTTKRAIRALGTEELQRRVTAWQEANQTSGLPSAAALGLEVVAYSVGVYGCTGHVYRDLVDGHLLGGTGYAAYII